MTEVRFPVRGPTGTVFAKTSVTVLHEVATYVAFEATYMQNATRGARSHRSDRHPRRRVRCLLTAATMILASAGH